MTLPPPGVPHFSPAQLLEVAAGPPGSLILLPCQSQQPRWALTPLCKTEIIQVKAKVCVCWIIIGLNITITLNLVNKSNDLADYMKLIFKEIGLFSLQQLGVTQFVLDVNK